METIGDKDYFAVTLVAGLNYQFTLARTDTYFAQSENLIGPNGVAITNNRAYLPGSTNIVYSPTSSGTYYIAVSNDGAGSDTGSYTIRAASVSATTPSTVTTTPATSTGAAGTPTPSSAPIYRFFDSKTGTQFLTSDAGERATVIATRPDLINEGVGLRAAPSADPNATAVYRFFDKVYGTHVFTSNADESKNVQATRADWSCEGVGFYEYLNQQINTTPVYRFFDSNKGTHFFTASASERATILSTRADLIPEGISFYSPST